MSMWSAAVLVKAAAAALAWRSGRDRPGHRPVGLLLSVGVVADLVRRAISVLALEPFRAANGAAPFAGSARLAFHLEQVLFLAWPAGLVAVALVTLAHRRPWGAFAAQLAANLGLAAAYPAIRGAMLAKAYLGLELVALAAVVGAGLVWWSRRERPSLTEGSTLLLGFVEFGAIIAYRQPFGAGWAWAQVIYFIAFGTLVVLHLGELWTSSRPRTSP
jgi:hypothetical protein